MVKSDFADFATVRIWTEPTGDCVGGRGVILRHSDYATGGMEARAVRANGKRGARSTSRFVGPQRIKMDSLRATRFCWAGILWSTVINTSYPAASAASSKAPFFSP